MASGKGREHAAIYLSIWDDPDFKALSGGAQRMYMLLLQQRKLEWSGVLPLNVPRWSTLSSDTSEESIWQSLDELAAARFIVMDKLTAEVLVRSFLRNDVARPGKSGRVNANLVMSALTACNRVDSPEIRAALVSEIRRIGALIPAEVEASVRFPDLLAAPPSTDHRAPTTEHLPPSTYPPLPPPYPPPRLAGGLAVLLLAYH